MTFRVAYKKIFFNSNINLIMLDHEMSLSGRTKNCHKPHYKLRADKLNYKFENCRLILNLIFLFR